MWVTYFNLLYRLGTRRLFVEERLRIIFGQHVPRHGQVFYGQRVVVVSVVEVDLEYPDHLHDRHNDYPLAVEHLTVTRDMLSEYNAESLFV